MKQKLLFGVSDDAEITQPTSRYTGKVEAPVYEPKNEQPHIATLCDYTRVRRLLAEIEASSLGDDEKKFLSAAAWRHAVFHYERIADYYAHASKEMQALMEASALVIIDFDQAIERGFVKLCDDIRAQYLEEYDGDAA